jgi:hypothetical protein
VIHWVARVQIPPSAPYLIFFPVLCSALINLFLGEDCTMKCHYKYALFSLVLLCLAYAGNVWAESGLVLEWEQHWETYGVGGTCNFGTHNFFVGDIDNDGVMEMVTGGLMYNSTDSTRPDLEAPLKIWNWDGTKFKIEYSYSWTGVIGSIYAADLDGDGSTELITGGRVTNSTGSYSSLRIWSYNGEVLILEDSQEGIGVSSICVNDLDNDGTSEILTVSRVLSGYVYSAQLCVWHYSGERLALLKSIEWGSVDGASANSVSAYDLNGDGVVEVITGGYDNGLTNSSSQLRVWHWKENELLLKVNEEWRMVEGVYGSTISGDPMGNTLVENLKVDDVDGDGAPEIVTGGFAYDGANVTAQLRIWNYAGGTLVLEKSHEWTTEDITEIKAIALDDVDGDKQAEIVTSGVTAVYGGFSDVDVPLETAQLRIWSWNCKELLLKYGDDWQVGEGVVAWNVATGDVDEDGTVEIVTVGCMYISALCDPDLRIWSIPQKISSIPVALLLGLGIVVITVLVTAVLFLLKRRKQP